MLRNDDDLAYIENCKSRCTTYMFAASQKILGRYLLNSGLCTTYDRPEYTSTHFTSTVLLLVYYYI